MIILINGSFGVGKTTVAELLVKRIPNSLCRKDHIRHF